MIPVSPPVYFISHSSPHQFDPKTAHKIRQIKQQHLKDTPI